ncbi:RING/FYVE/PHD zinc finger superfamily protein [Prunus dulcis]|uniref:RING/FYVE/PHD zinc finger superfamily protein n=1 Tax=Prunus dulcis TaxID=3755 RepID=A0A4Y1R1N3_PRUDU|nr:RING/FYVE/PHD zinc finger superfamily protein [Prunus dulcis]
MVMTCEICGSTARNVAGVTEAELVEQWSETNDTAMATSAAAPVQTAESQNFWQGHRCFIGPEKRSNQLIYKISGRRGMLKSVTRDHFAKVSQSCMI